VPTGIVFVESCKNLAIRLVAYSANMQKTRGQYNVAGLQTYTETQIYTDSATKHCHHPKV